MLYCDSCHIALPGNIYRMSEIPDKFFCKDCAEIIENQSEPDSLLRLAEKSLLYPQDLLALYEKWVLREKFLEKKWILREKLLREKLLEEKLVLREKWVLREKLLITKWMLILQARQKELEKK
jgi:hypothetical protein